MRSGIKKFSNSQLMIETSMLWFDVRGRLLIIDVPGQRLNVIDWNHSYLLWLTKMYSMHNLADISQVTDGWDEQKTNTNYLLYLNYIFSYDLTLSHSNTHRHIIFFISDYHTKSIWSRWPETVSLSKKRTILRNSIDELLFSRLKCGSEFYVSYINVEWLSYEQNKLKCVTIKVKLK